MIRKVDRARARLDLASANILAVGERSGEQDILVQMLVGFGVKRINRSVNAAEALQAAAKDTFDLAIIDASLKEMDGYALIKSFRNNHTKDVKFLPILVVCGHIRRQDLFKARDCGTNFVLTKPISPQTLFDRIVWLALDSRTFVETETYVGPDRRFKAFGPPVGMAGRRADDLSANIGEATGANMSQNDVDNFFSAKKVG